MSDIIWTAFIKDAFGHNADLVPKEFQAQRVGTMLVVHLRATKWSTARSKILSWGVLHGRIAVVLPGKYFLSEV